MSVAEWVYAVQLQQLLRGHYEMRPEGGLQTFPKFNSGEKYPEQR